MALCFYRLGYNSQKFESADPYFRDLCLKEFEYSCKEESLAVHPINLYFCDKVSDERLNNVAIETDQNATDISLHKLSFEDK